MYKYHILIRLSIKTFFSPHSLGSLPVLLRKMPPKPTHVLLLIVIVKLALAEYVLHGREVPKYPNTIDNNQPHFSEEHERSDDTFLLSHHRHIPQGNNMFLQIPRISGSPQSHDNQSPRSDDTILPSRVAVIPVLEISTGPSSHQNEITIGDMLVPSSGPWIPIPEIGARPPSYHDDVPRGKMLAPSPGAGIPVPKLGGRPPSHQNKIPRGNLLAPSPGAGIPVPEIGGMPPSHQNNIPRGNLLAPSPAAGIMVLRNNGFPPSLGSP